MKRLLAAALLCASFSAMADYVARTGDDYVRLQDKPCAGAVLEVVPPTLRDEFLTAFAQVAGKQYAACWFMRPDGVVIVQYADGDIGMIPVAAFKPEPGI